MVTEPAEASAPFAPGLEIDGPGPQRRWTVLLRLLLLIPHFLVLHSLRTAVVVVAVVGWFTTLVLGRLPAWIADFLVVYVGYEARVGASLLLLVDRYPPFVLDQPEFPVRVEVRSRPQNRLTVLFRLLLAIPAVVVVLVVLCGWSVLAFFLWLVVLVAGRTPRPVFDASAAVLRFAFRTQSYLCLLTSAYPGRLFGDRADEEEAGSGGTRPLVLSRGGRVLLVVFLVLGVLAVVGAGALGAFAPPSSGPHQQVWALGR